jgi:hypothetical protein
MFVRHKTTNGVTYYQVVRSIRIKDRVHQVLVVSLGTRKCRNLDEAITAAGEKYTEQWNRAQRIPHSWQEGDIRWCAEHEAMETDTAIKVMMAYQEKQKKRKR